MRDENGTASFYLVQHRHRGEGRWATSGGAVFLFEDLPYKQANGLQGDVYRALTDPIHRVWQATGENEGYETADQAWAVVDAIRERKHPRHADADFRVVHRTIEQHTVRVERPRSRAAA